MVWLQENEKKMFDTFTLFDRIYERDRQTDGQTDSQPPRHGISYIGL